MILIDLLDEKLIQFPIKPNDEDIYYPSYISILILDYIKLLNKYNVGEDIVNSVSQFGDDIFLTLERYYIGDHYGAYEYFKSAMEIFNEDLDNIIIELEEKEFFRARVNNRNSEDFHSNDMFHIPFELRTKVNTQRYSFPGLPCLYLGASANVCWMELNCPDLDKMNIARIEKNDKLAVRILDISRTPNIIKHEYDKNKDKDLVLNYLKVWPLIAICSVGVRNEGNEFKPEYIIPQMLLEWSIIEKDIFRTNHGISGIRYLSGKAMSSMDMHYQQKLNYPNLYINYVFPVITSKAKGSCSKLQEIFTITNTISGGKIKIRTPEYNIEILVQILQYRYLNY